MTAGSQEAVTGERTWRQALVEWASRHRWKIGWALFGVGIVLLVVASQVDDSYWQGLLVNLGTGLLLFLPLLVVGQLFERQVERRVEDEVADAASTVYEATEDLAGRGTSKQPVQGRMSQEALQYETEVLQAVRRVADRLRPQAPVAVEWPAPGGRADGILRWRGQSVAIEAKRSIGGLPVSSRRLQAALAQLSAMGMPGLLITDGRLTAEALSSLHTAGATGIAMVTWKGEEDDGALQAALVRLFAPG